MNPKKNQVVVNYSSKSYGSVLYRSPNSPPPSPSPLPPPSVAYLSHLFCSYSLQNSPASTLLALRQHQAPPLLPLPSSPARDLRRAQAKRKVRKNGTGGTRKVTANEERMVECLISPPPSSLPLPRFSLLRPKAAACGGGGGDGGARDCISEAAKGGGGSEMVMS